MDPMSPAALDRWLAEHVMGWRDDGTQWARDDGYGAYSTGRVSFYGCEDCEPWHPTANIAQAIECAEKARANHKIAEWQICRDHSMVTVHVDLGPLCPIYVEDDDGDIPLALCRALHAALA